MTKSLAEYYFSNYTHCPKDTSFLASWKGIAYPSHLIQAISLPIGILTAYCILKKTPKNMENVKNPLLIAHFGSCLLDFTIGTLCTPMYFLPAVSGIPLGVLSLINMPYQIQTLLGYGTAMFCFISMVALYENRSSLFIENKLKITSFRWKFALHGGHFLLDFALFTPILMTGKGDEEAAKLEILEYLPCPVEEFFSFPIYIPFFPKDSLFTYIVTIGCLFLLIIVFQFIFFISICTYCLFVASPRTTLSANTRRIQKRFFVSLVVQTAVPSIAFLIPVLVLLTVGYLYFQDQKLNNLAILVIGLHGIAESITIILIHPSYRKFVKSFFCEDKDTRIVLNVPFNTQMV